jgi:hypothetical protein
MWLSAIIKAVPFALLVFPFQTSTAQTKSSQRPAIANPQNARGPALATLTAVILPTSFGCGRKEGVSISTSLSLTSYAAGMATMNLINNIIVKEWS